MKHKGPSIDYVQTHDQTEVVCIILKHAGFNAHSYHAGMASDARTAVQDRFMASDDIIVSNSFSAPTELVTANAYLSIQIVATIAFGMGIDKSNIRNIVHYAIPKA